MEDDEYKKLPLDERCVHKLWKARVNGYEEVTKLFRQIDDEKSPEFAKYLGLVKKFVIDSNAMGQEKGLEATLAFAENYANAGKTVGEVMGGIVTKCIAAPKTKTRELALQVTLTYIEIEKQDAVIEELLKGLELKNPKIVSACVVAITTALREFGSKVIQLKPVVKKIPVLFADRDKNVRDEARLLVIEMYRWIGAVLKSQLSSLQPVQVTELEAEFAKIDGQKAVPIRYLRSQQEKQAKLAVEAAETGDGDEDEEDEVDEPVNLDPYEMADPVDILSKLPKDFYDKIEAKKWQERKEALETLENLLKSPKLENGDYGDLVRALRKMIQKDSNVVVVALAAKCLNGIASGLKKRFQPYASACIPAILEKFKEKKQNVVVALREAADAIYLAANLENILEDIMEALGNKNPSVKTETSLFLARAFTRTVPAVVNKKILKAFTGGLSKLINEPDPAVRDAAADAIGTLMKLVGEKAVAPFLVELEKDALKMGKIREYCEKAVILVKVPGAKKEKAKPKPEPQAQSAPSSASLPKPPPRRAATAVKKRPTTDISSGTATIVKSKGKPVKVPSKVMEKELTDEDVTEIVSDLFPDEVVNSLADANWKNRLSAVETFLSEIKGRDPASLPVQALVRTLCRKPGLKDTNFQVLKSRLDAIRILAGTGKFSERSATYCLNDITEKLGDAKNGASAGEALTAIAEATTLNNVATTVFDFAHTQKSPKVLQETLLWLGQAIKDFGFANLNPKFLIDNAKKALASNNAQVRSAAIALFGVLYLYMGQNLHMFIENEKPALREQINVEFDKYENEKPPTPIRGVVKSASTDDLEADVEDDDGGGDAPSVNIQDLLPKMDISGQITEALIVEMADRNWKVRIEALIKVSNIINDAKLIKPNIGELPQALAQRLVDSNTKIAQMALNICESIATSMGPPCKQHVRTLFPGFLQGLGDSKRWIRTASVQCMNTFADQGGYKEFFEGEMIHDALKSGSSMLRSELWCWLAEKLPKIKQVPKEELIICIPYLYSNLEDRNVEVRKNANEAILGVMIHVGFETMVKQLEKVKPASKSVVLAQLEKVRPNLPAKPAPTKRQATVSEEKDVKSGGRRAPNTAKAAAKPTKAAAAKPSARSKKDDDVDTSPLLVLNNLKHQRSIDESKLKVLKWNFTTPRQEFVDLLRDQMTTANVNKTLIANMFHADFKFHIKAIEALSDDLQDNRQALIANLDLILRWLTLRFFDTNPSVLLKGLEYLSSVFEMLIEHQYHLLENEATAFIPYLVTKIGDPKDAVRNGVKTLIKHLWSVYPVNKLFTYYLMEGLKSKNARQRAECLEAMALTISQFGLNICIPTPQACLKEIAKQLSDRDNSVRNGALNCAVQAYYIVGEKVFKMVGNISDKDMSLLEERIKRASKKPPPPQPLQTTKVNKIDLTQNMPMSSSQMSPMTDAASEDVDDDIDEQEADEEDDNLPEVALPSQVVERERQRDIPNPYRLDPNLIQQLDNMSEPLPSTLVEVFDTSFLQTEVLVPSVQDARARIIPVSPPKPILSTDVLSHTRSASAKSTEVLALERHMQALGGTNIAHAMDAVAPLEAILKQNKNNIMGDYEDKFMISLSHQLFNLHEYDPSKNTSCVRLYRHLLTLFELFFTHPTLGRKITTNTLKLIIGEFLKLLVEDRLDNVPNKESYIRVLNLHCVKLIERSDHTNCICALIQFLHECVRFHGNCRLTDINMKCLWRVIKIMPSWEDDIDCDRVLLDIHNFFKEFPTLWWRNKPSDTPIRTVKTILHSIAKSKGASLTEHLANIPNINDSELELFIHKMIRSLKLDEVKQVPLKTESRKMLPRASHTQLTDIFQKIGSKEETKEGLNQLYDFLEQNPESDIEPFLQRSSQFFQDYIQKNLKEIENERKNPPSAVRSAETNGNTALVADDVKDVKYYRQRLAQYQETWDRKNSKLE